MHKIVVTWNMESSFVERLREELYGEDVAIVQTGKERAAIYDEIGGASIILAGLADRSIMERAPGLKFVQALTSSVGRIDLRYAASRGIPVSSARGHNSNAVAEHVLMLMLMLSRKFGYSAATAYDVEEIAGKSVCALGVGYVGRAVGKKCHALGMKVMGVDAHPEPSEFFEDVHSSERLKDVVPEADYLTIHVPRTPKTSGLINAELLGRAKPSLYVVDVSRGGVTDVSALYDALKRGAIRGAAMDVFPGVFYPDDSPESHAIFGLENFIYTPHNAGKSRESRSNLVAFVALNVRNYLSGNEIASMVNPDAGY